MEFQTVYEDEWCRVINKPAGVVVNEAKSVKQKTVQAWWWEKIGGSISEEDKLTEFVDKQGIVHRLDKDTSGLLILAKNRRGYDCFKEQFLNRQVKKKYLAVVYGKIAGESGIISKPVVRNPNRFGKFMVGEDLSKMAITNWRKLEETKLGEKLVLSWLDIELLTGRTHQIRVHMSDLHHPVVGDWLYGGRQGKVDFQAARMLLNASELGFSLPNGRMVEVNIEVGNEFHELVRKLVH